MKRSLAAACAAMMLAGSLTACSTTAPTNDGTMTGPTGTTYNTAPGGTNENRNVGGARTSARTNRNNGVYNGRYTAYADGSLAGDPNGGSTLGQDIRDITKGINNAVRDMNRTKQRNPDNGNINNGNRNSTGGSNNTNDIINNGYRNYGHTPKGNSGNVGTNVPTANDINTGLD